MARCKEYDRPLTNNTDVHINSFVMQRQAMTLWRWPNGESRVHRTERRLTMSNWANKAALGTGGSRGIGAAIAKRLAADGASVAITYVKDANAASAVVKAIERAGRKAIAIQADAGDAEAVKGAVEKAVAVFGRLD